MAFLQLAVPGSQASHSKSREKEDHPTAKDPTRQPFSWYASFAEPYPLPDVSPVDRNKQSDKEISEQLKSLNKELASLQRRSAALAEEVRVWCRSDLARTRPRVVGGVLANVDFPLDELVWTEKPVDQTTAAKAAVTHADCLSSMLRIREQIDLLNARVERE